MTHPCLCDICLKARDDELRRSRAVEWKPIKGAKMDGTIYWLSGWKNEKPRTKRYVALGHYSTSDGGWVDDPEMLLAEPTHYADHFVPEPPK